MKFKELNLLKNTQTIEIKINDQVVNVKTYLPISDKIDLVQVALQKAE